MQAEDVGQVNCPVAYTQNSGKGNCIVAYTRKAEFTMAGNLAMWKVGKWESGKVGKWAGALSGQN